MCIRVLRVLAGWIELSHKIRTTRSPTLYCTRTVHVMSCTCSHIRVQRVTRSRSSAYFQWYVRPSYTTRARLVLRHLRSTGARASSHGPVRPRERVRDLARSHRAAPRAAPRARRVPRRGDQRALRARALGAAVASSSQRHVGVVVVSRLSSLVAPRVVLVARVII